MITVKLLNAWTSQLHEVHTEMARQPHDALNAESRAALELALDHLARAQTLVMNITAPTPKKADANSGYRIGGDATGTSLKGYLNVPFSRIVALLGEPEESDGYKVSAEWTLTFDDGTVATIYDWKQINLYDRDLPPPESLRLNEFSQWHVGGRSARAVELVTALFQVQA